MSTFILVHGSWHAAWCWYKVVPRLEHAGHRAIAIDLPGHGRDHRPFGQVTMQDCVEAIGVAIEQADEPPILVAHSRGGLPVTQAAEAFSGRIRLLIYLAAFLVPDGETVVPLAISDKTSLILPNLDIDREGGFDMLRQSAFREALYADCSEEDVALATMLLDHEPSGPTNTAISTTADRYETVPRAYIELTEDRAVTHALQKRMQERVPCRESVAIATSHSAYFSRPDELTSALIGLAERHALPITSVRSRG
ncbi:MAG: alpha/beta fold hydrolase [Chloroflexi bacterium]|nr:alpha/beta fold hydrolase [Chloroflexota bacterium]